VKHYALDGLDFGYGKRKPTANSKSEDTADDRGIIGCCVHHPSKLVALIKESMARTR
jgi:hypothetical protein